MYIDATANVSFKCALQNELSFIVVKRKQRNRSSPESLLFFSVGESQHCYITIDILLPMPFVISYFHA